ncbi:MAG: bifunctional diaminohydroxyphosphoribosylaminopyrimidine deaminase/5-amino-6-(5-phosphoribosylamino)uracil reductase RibD [Paludibacteraceae bacterium]|nr:bifunctional diaminohydroxyphosphoribosylaminopyrimidine deaminase/5-amino-6-(5-phosphoribosylamino)uracil reductase RibD [Paludibacteraceae bacterium]
MMRCLTLAAKGIRSVAPNPMVGAVLVCDGRIIGEGWHRRYGEAHAEVNCFASVKAKDEALIPHATLYVSLEPCSHYGKTPPCAKLVVSKHPKRVVVGMGDPNPLVAGKGIDIIKQAGIEVVCGVLEQQCRELNKRFLCLQEKHRPYITLKWAQSADGFIDAKRHQGEPKTPVVISNSVSKITVHKMRAENMAILVGANTALLDNPRLLTTRWTGNNPLRCAIDSKGVIPDSAHLMSNEAETIIFHDLPDLRTNAAKAWETIYNELAGKGIHSLIIEGGAVTLQSVIDCGMWDEAQVEVGTTTIGKGVKAPKIGLLPQSVKRLFNHTIIEYLHQE